MKPSWVWVFLDSLMSIALPLILPGSHTRTHTEIDAYQQTLAYAYLAYTQLENISESPHLYEKN